MIAPLLLGYLPLAIWVYLIFARGGFWLTRERDDRGLSLHEPQHWPSVTAVVPARNEAETITGAIGGLLAQDYPGPFRVILVDDESDDGTCAIARTLQSRDMLTVMTGAQRPAGWTGKLWAVAQGVANTSERDAPDYLWLTDADIVHAPDTLRSLVRRADANGLTLVSLMAKLRCESFAERFLIPAFVYFFQMLYPFAHVNDPHSKLAAGAGGCMLVRRTALEAAGGIQTIRREIIDDCALARLLKAQGPIWLGLTRRSLSVRKYSFADIGRMVARSAYAELRYSPLLLALVLIALLLIFVAPPIWAALGEGAGRYAAVAAWTAMVISFRPMLHFYDRFPLWGLLLPLIGLFYAGFTFQSAIQHWRGRGGMWKGRAQAMASR
jgi:hopene-associated glycosyltransferase HpnB